MGVNKKVLEFKIGHISEACSDLEDFSERIPSGAGYKVLCRAGNDEYLLFLICFLVHL